MKKLSLMLFLFFIVFYSLNAAIYKKTTLSHMINTSTTIIKGEVIGVYTYWKTDEKKNIFRDVTIEIESTIKGESKKSITVSLMGGEIEDLKQEIDDVPELKLGDKGVFFIVNHKGKNWIHSLSLGYYQIIEQSYTGDEILYNKYENSVVKDDINASLNNKNLSSGKYKLNEFIEAVAAYVKKAEGK